MPEDLARLADTALKLFNETKRLRRDLQILLKRFPVPEDELGRFYATPPGEHIYKHDPTASDAINVIREARAIIESCERDLSAIRNRIDEIAEDVHSREDFKHWIKPRPSRR